MRKFTDKEQLLIDRIHWALKHPYVQRPQSGFAIREGRLQLIGEQPEQLTITHEVMELLIREIPDKIVFTTIPGPIDIEHPIEILLDRYWYRVTKDEQECMLYHLERVK